MSASAPAAGRMLVKAIENCKKMMGQRGYTMRRDWFDAPWTHGKGTASCTSTQREDDPPSLTEEEDLGAQDSDHPSDDAASLASDVSVADVDDASEMSDESDPSVYLDAEDDPANPGDAEGGPHEACGHPLLHDTGVGDASLLRVIQQRREAYLPIATWHKGTDVAKEIAFLYVNSSEKFGIRDLRNVSEVHSAEEHVVIVICEQGDTVYCNKQLLTQGLRGFVNVFRVNEMQIDRARMVHIPKHELCAPGQRAALLERFGLTEESAVTQLPILRQDDIMSRYYNFRPGDLVYIDRHHSQQVVRYYRLVQ